MLEQFWLLAKAAETLFTESFTMQLGFGQCSKVRKRAHADALALRRQAAMKSLLAMPSVPRPKLPTSATNSSTLLLDAEAAEKQRWAARLEAVAGRAGDHAELNKHEAGDETLTGPERERIKNLVLSSGAPKTMAAHIRRWEKLERWCSANSVTLYPLTIDAVVKYALFLDSKECGPTVIPSLRSALKWVGSRLAIKLPDLQDKRLLALETDVFQKRAKMIKEAIAMPFKVVQAMEKFVCSGKEPAAARIFTWWLLCMVFASLRFNDAIQVKPLELEMRPRLQPLGALVSLVGARCLHQVWHERAAQGDFRQDQNVHHALSSGDYARRCCAPRSNAPGDRFASKLERSRAHGPQVHPQSLHNTGGNDATARSGLEGRVRAQVRLQG